MLSQPYWLLCVAGDRLNALARERKFFFAWHLEAVVVFSSSSAFVVIIVVVVVVDSLAATHISTSLADTHEAPKGDSRSPFSDAQTH